MIDSKYHQLFNVLISKTLTYKFCFLKFRRQLFRIYKSGNIQRLLIPNEVGNVYSSFEHMKIKHVWLSRKYKLSRKEAQIIEKNTEKRLDLQTGCSSRIIIAKSLLV